MDERLARIVAELGHERYARARRLPPPMAADDAAEIARALAEAVDDGTQKRAEKAAEDGIVIACGRGCNACCEEPILVELPEAQVVAEWLGRPENQHARAAFLAAYPAWRAAAGDGPARLADLIERGDKQGYDVAHVAEWRRRVLCAFNQGGDCTIYPVRPITCRNAHAVDTSERCRGDNPSGLPATRLAFEPLDRFLLQADRVLKAAHHATGGERNRPAALCDAVYRLLSG
jgi:hypothetical protein